MSTKSSFKKRLEKYFDLCDKHDEEKLNFFPEYIAIVKKAEEEIYKNDNFEEGERLLNSIPEDIRRIWKPASELGVHIEFNKVVNNL